MKITEWINPQNYYTTLIFQLNIEHLLGEDGFKRIKEFYIYFQQDDFSYIKIDPHLIEVERKILEKSTHKGTSERDLHDNVSPLSGYILPIFTDNAIIADNGYKKRIEVRLKDYEVNENIKKRKIYFPMIFKKSITFYEEINEKSTEKPWKYNFYIEPYQIQTLKWDEDEFMPHLESLQVWLQMPRLLYRSLPEITIKPIGNFEQMFLLGKSYAKKFKAVGQNFAEKDTLCINWDFRDLSVSSPSIKVEMTYGFEEDRIEEDFIQRFNEKPSEIFLILRELLYTCKAKTLDFNYVISEISDKNLKEILRILNEMVFKRNSRPTEQYLDDLIPFLKKFIDCTHGKEFLYRYSVFNELLKCIKSEDFYSEPLNSYKRTLINEERLLDPIYKDIIDNIDEISRFTKKFNIYTMDDDKPKYKDKILNAIERVSNKWDKKLMDPDRYILRKIFKNWKEIVVNEYEEQVAIPHLESRIITKIAAYADRVGIIFEVKNSGNGEACEVQARVLPSDNYEIIIGESEINSYVRSGGLFKPELVISPENSGEIEIYYEIKFKDSLGREKINKYRNKINIIKKEIVFQKIKNPYIIGDIVRETKMFYGRQSLIGDIRSTFEGKYQKNSIFLHGQRRIGKSSLLYQLKKLLQNGFIPVYINTLQFFGKKSFYRDLMEEIKNELKSFIEIPEISEDPFDFFKKMFYQEIKKQIGTKKLLLLIDEYQRIDDLITQGGYKDDVIDFLNALIQDGEIKIIIAGNVHLRELKNKKWIELMQNFIPINISFLSRDDTIKLICEPVEGHIEFDEGAIEKILSLSACSPYLVQLICYTMVEHHNENRINLIKYEDVCNHLVEYLEKGQNVFMDIFYSQPDKTQDRVLFQIYKTMEKKKITSVDKSDLSFNIMSQYDSIDKENIDRTLSKLEEKEIIQKSDDHPDLFEFTADLYRHWVKWNIPMDIEEN
jgi:hypothetical protein